MCFRGYHHFEPKRQWIDRAIAATQKASATGNDAPEIQCAEAWIMFAEVRYDEAAAKIRTALNRDPDLDGGNYLLGRALFSAGRYQEVVEMMEEALAHAGDNYNTAIPIHNALGALGKKDALNNYLHREAAMYEKQLKNRDAGPWLASRLASSIRPCMA